MIHAPRRLVAAAWQVLTAERRGACARCGGSFEEGDLFALHPVSRFPYHPTCAGQISAGAVAAPPLEVVRPSR